MSRSPAHYPQTMIVTSGPLHHHTLSSYSKNGTLDDEQYTDAPYDYYEYYAGYVDSHGFSCIYENYGASILPVLYSLFFVVGFLGNIMAICVVSMGVRLKSMTDICLLNLAIADLLLVCSLPFLAHYARDQWIFGDVMCTIVLSVYHIGFYSGIFFIVLMSVDRYLAEIHAVFAIRVRTRTYGISASVVTWIVAVSASFPELTHLKTTENNKQKYCISYTTNYQNSYLSSRTFGILKMNLMGLILPLIVIVFCYSIVLKRLLTAHSTRRRSMHLVITMMVVFFCCWVPYNVTAFVKALELNELITQSCDSSKAISLTLQITEALAYSHSCLNPILYVFVREKFRRNFFKLLYRIPCTRLKFVKKYITQTTVTVYSHSTSDERISTTI
ncbi:C-C chemokine receptor type 5-like [Puntigrus tetrazona]|uniref:C-C chemokine receptor type 5-like n=1 Tax=Puntigrus tetrazona TaxID=1606681 RepID=UPI001C8964B9|nr:C-C chemokine receptor type 5-like [Puntigrus tetrazona]